MSEGTPNNDLISSPQADYDSLRHVTPETLCHYLPGRMARHEVYSAEGLNGHDYARLLGRGFRRSGRIIYRPRCRGCQECRQIRVPVSEFVTSRSMRRIMRRNADLHVEIGPPAPTPEKFDLYCKYLTEQHDGQMNRDLNSFISFLYDSPLESFEFLYYLGARLIGVSLADRVSDGLSSVYMFFDPDHAARSLGTFSGLWEIDYCRKQRLSFYYLGYYVAESETMAYKSRFRPNQILVADDRWVALRV